MAVPALGEALQRYMRLHELASRMRAVPAASAPASVAPPDALQISDEAFLKGLYRELLGREPDPQGFRLHLANLRTGTARDVIRRSFLASPEYQARLAPSPEPSAPANVPHSLAPATAPRAWSLGDYPRANPLGMHGLAVPIDSKETADWVLDKLGRLGARNVLILSNFPVTSRDGITAAERYFLQEADKRGVTVQIRMHPAWRAGDTSVDEQAVARFAAQVKEATGGKPPYLQIGNEPNLAEEWGPGTLPNGKFPVGDGYVDRQAQRFADWWIKYAKAVDQGGGLPGFPGMATGTYDAPDGGALGEFAFYEMALRRAHDQAPEVFDHAWISSHPYGSPVYAADPAQGRPEKTYQGIGGYTGQVMWQLDRFHQVTRDIVGRDLPVLVTEGGWGGGAAQHGSVGQARDQVALRSYLKAIRPDWLVVGTADWLLSNRGAESWPAYFYDKDGRATPWAQELEAHRDEFQGVVDTARR